MPASPWSVKSITERQRKPGMSISSSERRGRPPRGHGTHHSHLKLYALDDELAVGECAAKPDLLKAMEGHALGQAELVGTYSR